MPCPYGGEAAVAAYAVASYIVESVMLFLSGIGEGLQPLISYLKGAREYQQMKASEKQRAARGADHQLHAVRDSLPRTRGRACRVWHIARGQRTDGQCAAMVRIRVPAHCRCQAFLFLFYAVGEDRLALFMIYADPCFFTPALLITLPLIFAIDGI